LSIEFAVRPAEKWPAEPASVKPAQRFRSFCYAGRIEGLVWSEAAMRFVRLLLGFVLGVAICGTAAAQTREDMLRCRSISDEARRLACYDAVELTGNPLSKYEIVDLGELKSFALSYRGQLVEVRGWIKPADDLLFLGLDEADADPIPIDFQAIPRRDQQAFLEACGEGCEATVQGRVRPVNFTTGIVADTLTAR
jgi:hypothetical protein